MKKLLDAASTSPTLVFPEPKKLYRIQTGAFSFKTNAAAMLAKVKATGFADAYIKID